MKKASKFTVCPTRRAATVRPLQNSKTAAVPASSAGARAYFGRIQLVASRLCLVLLIGFAALSAPSPVSSKIPLFEAAKRTFVQATRHYQDRQNVAAMKVLKKLWRKYPVGDAVWGHRDHKVAKLHYGSPPFYYALMMLSEVTHWRLKKKPQGPASKITLRIVLIGKSAGLQPRSPGELTRRQGVVVRHVLHNSLRNDRETFHQSLWLFREYVAFITGGKLDLKIKFLDLPNVSVPVRVAASPLRMAGLDYQRAWPVIWNAIPADIQASSDWWWILYPSHVPPKSAGFGNNDFITGGMAAGARGEPVFLIDDLWLVRKPPHLGAGDYSDLERQAYLPQWLQHEFFHHLFRNYPEFKLEAKSHQWFDWQAWPKDFKGQYEPDYYANALHKRLMNARPPLHVTLRHLPNCGPCPNPEPDNKASTGRCRA